MTIKPLKKWRLFWVVPAMNRPTRRVFSFSSWYCPGCAEREREKMGAEK
jgi:hypothetical protein